MGMPGGCMRCSAKLISMQSKRSVWDKVCYVLADCKVIPAMLNARFGLRQVQKPGLDLHCLRSAQDPSMDLLRHPEHHSFRAQCKINHAAPANVQGPMQ